MVCYLYLIVDKRRLNRQNIVKNFVASLSSLLLVVETFYMKPLIVEFSVYAAIWSKINFRSMLQYIF